MAESGKVTRGQTANGLDCLAMGLNLVTNRESIKGHILCKDGHLDVSVN